MLVLMLRSNDSFGTNNGPVQPVIHDSKIERKVADVNTKTLSPPLARARTHTQTHKSGH